jgi:hypothetical protein
MVREVEEAMLKVDAVKVAKLILAVNEALNKIEFPFSPVELQTAFNYLSVRHILTAASKRIKEKP